MAVHDEHLGRRVRCPHCPHVVTAPADGATGEAFAADDAELFAIPSEGDGAAGDEAKRALPSPNGASTGSEPDASLPEPLPARSAADRPRAHWFAAFIVPYAICTTVLAIYFYIQYRGATSLHPLELIPDVLGEFKNTTTRDGAQVVRLPPPDAELPAHLKTALGRPITVGQVEVTPLRVEQRPVVAYRRDQPGAEPETIRAKRDSLILHVRLKNVSRDVSFHPTDPFFDRCPRDAADRPYTLVEVGPQKFYGGVMEYHPRSDRTGREWLRGQEDDAKPLPPGETRETILATHPSDPVVDAVRRHAGPAVWRVHVRRGLTRFRGRDVPVTAVIGVEFAAADIVKPGPG
jgi:hypothetical protein